MPLASLIKIEWCCFNTTSCEALLSRHASHDYLILPHQRTLTVHSFADDLIITRVLKSYLVIKALCCIEQTLCQRLACRMYSCRHLRLLRDVFAIQSRRFICLDCAHKSSNKASCIHNTRRLANWYLLCTWTTLTYLFLHEPCSWH